MKLYSLLPKNGDEVTVHDDAYDTETYFYYSKSDLWDRTMLKLSKLLDVTETRTTGGQLHVCVNLSELIEKHLDKTGDLFIRNDIDSIMDGIDTILAGYVSEDWLKDFVDILSK